MSLRDRERDGTMGLALRLSNTTCFLAVWAIIGTVRAAEEKVIEVGDAVPEFQVLDDRGAVWNSQDHIGKQLLVIYFYPSDFSFCCTRQALAYRKDQEELAKFGAQVFAISGD